MVTQPELFEQSDGVGGKDVLGAFAGVQREQDRDQSAYNMGVAVAVEAQRRAGGAIRFHMGEQPDLAGATAHLVGFGVSAFRQRRQRAAELDDVTIAVVPLIEQGEILNDFVNGRHAANI